MDLYIDIRWLLERQAEVLPKQPSIHDFSALVAAVGRHRVETPHIGATVDNAWRAAALMHTIIRLRAVPTRNALFGAGLAAAYMHATGVAFDTSAGDWAELARDIDAGYADVYDAADRIRSWST